MSQQCRSCGAALRAGARFCDQCGAAVGALTAGGAPQVHEVDAQFRLALARCTKTKQPFALRFERDAQAPETWIVVDTLQVQEGTAQRGGYGSAELTGAFMAGPQYHGCPYCGARSTLRCQCGKLACWNGTRKSNVCPWCGAKGQVSGPIDSISSVDDL